MLVLSRRVGETVVLDGDIQVTVVAVQGSKVRLAFKAPSKVRIHREEIYERGKHRNYDIKNGNLQGRNFFDVSRISSAGK